jgi:AraC-like DNA-binding protein
MSSAHWKHDRSVAGVKVLTDYGLELGIPANDLLAGAGIEPAQLSDPDGLIAAEQELSVVQNLRRKAEDPVAVGLELGSRYHFSSFGVFGYALVTSATGADALAFAMRYLPLTFAFTDISVSADESWRRLRFGADDLPAGVGSLLLSRDMAAAAQLLHEIGPGDFRLARFDIAAEPPHTGAAPRRVFGAEVRWRAPESALTFDASYLETPLPLANAHTAMTCERMCAALMRERRVVETVGGAVRRLIAQAREGRRDLGSVAQRLNLSERTLKRRLKAENTSFRAIVTDWRFNVAERLLAEGGMTLADVAEKLEFSDLSSFSQAFRRWTGQPPSAYQRLLRRDVARAGPSRRT